MNKLMPAPKRLLVVMATICVWAGYLIYTRSNRDYSEASVKPQGPALAYKPFKPKEHIFDIQTGTIYGVPPTWSNREIMESLPFYDKEQPEGSEHSYGGGVFFLRQNYFYYTGADTLEVRAPFKVAERTDALNKGLRYFKERFGEPDVGTLKPFEPGGKWITARGLVEAEPEGFTNYVFATPYGHLSVLARQGGTEIRRVRVQHNRGAEPDGRGNRPLGPRFEGLDGTTL